jgi:hypothetical protein
VFFSTRAFQILAVLTTAFLDLPGKLFKVLKKKAQALASDARPALVLRVGRKQGLKHSGGCPKWDEFHGFPDNEVFG